MRGRWSRCCSSADAAPVRGSQRGGLARACAARPRLSARPSSSPRVARSRPRSATLTGMVSGPGVGPARERRAEGSAGSRGAGERERGEHPSSWVYWGGRRVQRGAADAAAQPARLRCRAGRPGRRRSGRDRPVPASRRRVVTTHSLVYPRGRRRGDRRGRVTASRTTHAGCWWRGPGPGASARSSSSTRRAGPDGRPACDHLPRRPGRFLARRAAGPRRAGGAVEALFCDLNDDGRADLIVANAAENSVWRDPGSYVYLNGPHGLPNEPDCACPRPGP